MNSRNTLRGVRRRSPPGADDGRRERINSMETFKIKVKEIHIGTFDVEAESREDALKKFEEEYWKNPNDYLLEPEDTFFE